ncbi:MAG: T9SS type A sorting domain-containing protein, partial [Saprospiraceae bacterium]|nr:T9SS type A sorting domain-containing protein [Saprospiraceae bacterium]
LVCDTPPESQSQYSAYSGCTGINPPFDFENIMSYYNFGRCAKHFTEEQGARMRYYLKNEYGALNQVVQQDIVITGTVDWNIPMNVPANVYIEPGAVLNINAPVTMQEHAYIYIKANHTPSSATYGGRLVVSNLITAACPGKLWQGVIVDGDENQLQSTQKQAKLSLKSGGIIEHALIGARVKGQNLVTGEILDYATGGVVISGLGIFRNNVQDIFFAAYSEVNSSTIIRTSFITNDNYRGGATAPTHITMDRVKNIRFIECKFNDLRLDDYTSFNSRGIGIDAKGSKFSITGASEFTNLFQGVHITNLSPLLGNSIIGATFNHCFTGIHSAFNANFLFNNNTFNIARPNNFKDNSPQDLIGIYMQGLTEAFSVSGNQFSGDANASFNDQTFGTDVLSITKSNNTITKNTFQDLYTGNRANGSNAMDNNGIYSGLQYTCNRFQINYFNDNNVKPNGALRKVQGGFSSDGIQKFSAGNIFNENTPLFAQQFTNEGKDFDYHHIPFSSQGLSQGFYTPTTIKPFPSSTNPDCDSGGEPGCNNPPCAEPFIAQTKSQFYQKKQQWQSKLAVFPNITNNSQREIAGNSINTLRYELDSKGKTILLHYALDTNEIKIDSILHWLDLLDNYDADLQLAQYHFFNGNFAISDPLIQSIPTLYGLDDVMLTEFNSIISVLQTMRTSIQAGVEVDALPNSVVDALQSGWGTACNSAGALTRAVLYLNGRRSLANCDGVQGRDLPVVSSTNLNDLKVFPNPANSSVTIERTENHQSLDIRIVNLATGRNDIHATMALTQKSISLDTSNLVSGVYAVFVDNSLLANTFKLVIQH